MLSDRSIHYRSCHVTLCGLIQVDEFNAIYIHDGM